jgi:hypothetical protein
MYFNANHHDGIILRCLLGNRIYFIYASHVDES